MHRRPALENERRNHVRHVFELQSEGTLSLIVDGQPMTILEVQDISPFGIGLLIDGHVINGREVGLRYAHGRFNIEISGAMVWNSIVDSESHKSSIGIYFHQQDMLSNIKFFNAITA
jgi:hypothetical protein